MHVLALKSIALDIGAQLYILLLLHAVLYAPICLTNAFYNARIVQCQIWKPLLAITCFDFTPITQTLHISVSAAAGQVPRQGHHRAVLGPACHDRQPAWQHTAACAWPCRPVTAALLPLRGL